jgi:hypothetical protein
MKKKIITTLLFCICTVTFFCIHNFYMQTSFFAIHKKGADFEKKASEVLISSTYSKIGLVHEYALLKEKYENVALELAERDSLRDENLRLKNLLDLKEQGISRVKGVILFNSFDTESGNIVVQVDNSQAIEKKDPVFASESTTLIGFVSKKEDQRILVSLISAPQTFTQGYIKINPTVIESPIETKVKTPEVYHGTLLGLGSGTMEMRIPTGVSTVLESAVYTEDGFLVGYTVAVQKGSQNEQIVQILSPVNIAHMQNISIGTRSLK